MSKSHGKKGRPSKKVEMTNIKPETLQLKYETALDKAVKRDLTPGSAQTFKDVFLFHLPEATLKRLSKPYERILINELLYRYTNIINQLTFKGITTLAKEASKRATNYLQKHPNHNKPIHKMIFEGVAYGEADHSHLKKKPEVELKADVKFALKNAGMAYNLNAGSALQVENRRIEKYGKLQELHELLEKVELESKKKAMLAAKRGLHEALKKEELKSKKQELQPSKVAEEKKEEVQKSVELEKPITPSVNEPQTWVSKEAEHKDKTKQVLANHRHQMHQERVAQHLSLLTQKELAVRFGLALIILMMLKSVKRAMVQRRSPAKIYAEIYQEKAEERKLQFAERIRLEREQQRTGERTR